MEKDVMIAMFQPSYGEIHRCEERIEENVNRT
jgi:hypothetical protein